MHIRSWMIGCGLFFLFSNGFPDTPHIGVSLSIPAMSKDPEYLHAYQLSTWYQPRSFVWGKTRLYLNASAGHFWVTSTDYYHSLNIFSISPILRYYFQQNSHLSPFFNIGIGLAYMTRTRLDDRNLGMHFAFQDQLGFGVSFGKRQQISVIINALHYSNGSLGSSNAGITIPIMVTVDYGF